MGSGYPYAIISVVHRGTFMHYRNFIFLLYGENLSQRKKRRWDDHYPIVAVQGKGIEDVAYY